MRHNYFRTSSASGNAKEGTMSRLRFGRSKRPDPTIHTPPGATTTALEKLRLLIENQGLQPGMKLPPERELAAQLAVGRPTLREAIKALSMLDVIESRRGAGTFIKSLGGLHL